MSKNDVSLTLTPAEHEILSAVLSQYLASCEALEASSTKSSARQELANTVAAGVVTSILSKLRGDVPHEVKFRRRVMVTWTEHSQTFAVYWLGEDNETVAEEGFIHPDISGAPLHEPDIKWLKGEL